MSDTGLVIGAGKATMTKRGAIAGQQRRRQLTMIAILGK